ncbi:hypothetical protein LPJ61_000502 [Coemansia biformis]|uniref:Ankyrin n=1 Tax=Coemansia biformis TaxID=1286918 RepID=A0A9W7YHR2_9FUNG|nr:hypothetical protein LPJ61_000502 [Coemansia biformis]
MSDTNKGPAPRTRTRVPPVAGDIEFCSADPGLHCAVSRGDIGSICYALLGGQAIDGLRDGLQPIHVAATQSDPAVVEMLLQNGADANARSVAAAKAPATGAQSAALPPRKAHPRTLRSRSSFSLFKSAGAGSISAPSGFSTGTHAARPAPGTSDCPPSGPSDPHREYHGATPLHFAVAGANVACVEALLRGGARTDLADSYGNTPASLAAACGSADVAALLLHDGLGRRPSRDATACERKPESPPPDLRASAPLSPDPEECRYVDAGIEPNFADQLPSPSPSDHSCLGSLPVATATAAPAPTTTATARRHTAGDVDAYLHYGNDRLRPANSWTKLKHRDASPIGIRALSISYSQRHLEAAGRHVGGDSGVSRSSSGASSRRERSYTDSIIERAWRSYVYHGDEQARENAHKIAADGATGDTLRPLPEPWMWQQAAVAVRSRRTQSLSVAAKQAAQPRRPGP